MTALELNGVHVGRTIALFGVDTNGFNYLLTSGLLTGIVHAENTTNIYLNNRIVPGDDIYRTVVEFLD
jgi:hypothetical protein